MSLIPDFYLRSVLSIGKDIGSETKWFGTGFLICKEMSGARYQPFLVTNKHILDNEFSIKIRFTKKESSELLPANILTINNGEKVYSVHPDSKVDIAVMLLNGSYFTNNDIELFAINIDKHALSSSEYIEEGGGEGSGVYMLGYPMGLVDIDSNSPICRAGCIARMDNNEVDRDKNYILDIQNFPGNSGSPIISRPELISIEGTKSLKRATLIGIANSYYPFKDTLISTQTGQPVVIRSENSGLAKANPVEYIREVMDLEIQRVYHS